MPLSTALRPAVAFVGLSVALVGLSSGCATLRSLGALSQVSFELDGMGAVRLAGVDLERIRSYDDLSVMDVARIGSAISSGQLPLDATFHIGADNPGGNPEARLGALAWTLYLRGVETVTGDLPDPIRLPSGERTRVPVRARLDLVDFFDGGMRDLVELAIHVAGVDGEPVDVRLELRPTVETPLGPIRYPRPLVVGGGVATGAGGR